MTEALAVGPAASPALAALHAAAGHGRAWDEAEFTRLLETPGAFAFVAPAAGPEGFVLGWATGEDAEILTIAVVVSARRRGLGRALLDAAAAAARAAGARRLVLEVAADNAPARALYGAARFAQIGVRPRYYETASGAVDALVLARTLL